MATPSPERKQIIDLLEALNITRSIKGVSKAKGLEPEIPAWKFRNRVPHLTLPRDYSIYFLSTTQGSIGFHFVAKQTKNSEGTLLSFVSPAAMKKDGHPLLQLVSSTKSNQLRFEYRDSPNLEPASILFPGGTPFAGGKWARVALNVEAHKVTLFTDCEETIIFEKGMEDELISLTLPIDLEITFASTAGDKTTKFLGYWQTAEISPTGFTRRPWHCPNLPDSMPLPYSLLEERFLDAKLETALNPGASLPPEPLLDIRNYQQQQSEPEASTRGPRPRPESPDERIQRLEDALDNLVMMLDMVKAQNTDLLVRVKYLEGCECRRPKCSWEGREYEEGSSWDKDKCSLCSCVKGEVRCLAREDRPQCVDACATNPCQNGGVCRPLTSDPRQHPSGFRCECPPSSAGHLCEMPMIQACSMPKAEGQCNGALEKEEPGRRWFYNTQSGRCEEFIFSGCRGNSNSFRSREECIQHCEMGACCFRVPRVTGVPVGYDHEGYDRYGYNVSGVNRSGRKMLVFNPVRSGPALFGPNGQIFSGLNDGRDFDKYGFDKEGYDREGFHKDTGFNLTGYNRKGEFDGRSEFSAEGYNSEGFNRADFDCSGVNVHGFNYLGLCAGLTYRCEYVPLSRCQTLGGRDTRSELVSFTPGKKCEEVACMENCGCPFNGRTYRFGESFEHGCEVCLCGYTSTVECNCRHVNQRKEIRDMTPEDRRIYQKAIQQLYSNQGIWEGFARLRAEFAPQATGELTFLPWHRYFLRAVERELQMVSSCDVSIPYFEWTIDAGSMETSTAWQANFFGGNGEPETECVLYHPFRGPRDWSPCLRRNFNTSITLPDIINMQLILAEDDFRHFSIQLEAISGLFHLWVGGHMASPFSPYDPIFLSHYAFIDKLWAHWQEHNPNELPRYPPEVRYVKMKPFNVAPDDVFLSQQQLCIMYVPVTLGAPCNITEHAQFWGFGNDGYDRHGFDSKGYDRDGYNRQGFNRRGQPDHRQLFNHNSYNSHGYDRGGFDQLGWDQHGYGRDNFDRDGFDAEGYDTSGYNRYGFNRSQVSSFGMSLDGTYLPHVLVEVVEQLFPGGYNAHGYDKFGLDRGGFDVFGFNIEGYDKDSCNYFLNGPHYMRFYFFVQQQITMIGPDILSNIKRVCPTITQLPEWWLVQNWMTVDVQETIAMIRHFEQKWASQHPFDSNYIPNISSVRQNTLWLPVTPDLRFCFELHWFSGCPLGTAPVACPDLCKDARCLGYPEAECHMQRCGSCFTEWYEGVTGGHVMCQGCSYDGVVYKNGDSFTVDSCNSCICLSGDVSCSRKQCEEVSCDTPVYLPGECCPRCPTGCKYEGKTYENGDFFLSLSNPCMNCSCRRAHTLEQVSMRVGVPSQTSVPVQLLNSNMSSIVLQDSLVRCFPMQCQQLSCASPIQTPGQCCPSCPGPEQLRLTCIVETSVLQEGGILYSAACQRTWVRCWLWLGSRSRSAPSSPEDRVLGSRPCTAPSSLEDRALGSRSHSVPSSPEDRVLGSRPCTAPSSLEDRALGSRSHSVPSSPEDRVLGSRLRTAPSSPEDRVLGSRPCTVPSSLEDRVLGSRPCTVPSSPEDRVLGSRLRTVPSSLEDCVLGSRLRTVPSSLEDRMLGSRSHSVPSSPEDRVLGSQPCTAPSSPEDRVLGSRLRTVPSSPEDRVLGSRLCTVPSSLEDHDGRLSCRDVHKCPRSCTHGMKPPFGSCCRDCSSCDFQGQLIPDGTSFVANGDVCDRCVCKNGDVLCSRVTCPELDCVAREDVSGECCQRCRGCVDGGIQREHTEEWRSPGNPCRTCKCLEGQVQCEKERCITSCRNPSRPRAGECCPTCDGCLFNGREYRNGEGVANGDPCANCTCMSGDVLCDPVSCRPALCRNPVQGPGDCCPRCNECRYDSQTFADGQVFVASHDPCLSCRCTAGEVSCDQLDLSCPPVQCSHPGKVRGQCCPTCDHCEYENEHYTNGQTFTPPGSGPCLQCTCQEGSVHCQEEVCPPALCANPMIDPQFCCPICKVCVLEGLEFEDGTEWEPDEDPCSTCVCLNGDPVCQAMQCPSTSCLHPTKRNGDCCPSCTKCTYNQRIYNDGQEFRDPDSPCQTCHCRDGSVRCTPTACPPVTCPNPERRGGHCCPKCPDCSFDNRIFVDGERFSNPLNPCQECVCYNGQVTCENRDCPGAICTYPLPGSCCQNNCNGCNYAGKEYPNGAEFPHPTDKCRECHCINGNVQCLTRRCPPLLCNNPFMVPGECCPQCPAAPAECLYMGLFYRHMERFYDPSDKCRSCICNNGTVTCQRKPCAPILCTHPLLQDCCRTCDGCLYNGKELANGEQFPDASEPCNMCVCQEGSVACDRKPCPVLDCPFPVKGQCCAACEGCEYLGEEYLNGQEFVSPREQCTRCSCVSGFVSCSRKPCYNPGCAHPITLPGHCCPLCEGCFYNGVAVNNRQTFPDPSDPQCSQCSCRSGSVHCMRKVCAPAPCPHPVTGPCDCPLCDGCRFQGRDYLHGETFPATKGTCEECRCLRGEVTCSRKTCPKVSCPHPAVDLCACPVCDGCSFHGRDCLNGERFPDPDNQCNRCTCLNGGVTCVAVTCPPTSCRNPITRPGECCPQCTGVCRFQGRVYNSGATFDSPADQCSKCNCLNEVVTCVRKSCPQQCSHPVPSSTCCPACNHCFYEGHEFENRQAFSAPTDSCQRCSCLAGNVLCTAIICPQTPCANPISKPGFCCAECPAACIHFGKEYPEGSHWVSLASCEDCSCTRGEVLCSQLQCDEALCSHPALVPGQCCPVCHDCLLEGVTYSHGEAFLPDPCRQCTCRGGSVHCLDTLCPRLSCMHQVTEPGICCPRCRGCIYNGKEYRDGSTWFASTTTPCMSCMCVDGVTTCSEIRCVMPCVNQVQVPGECCPLCADCIYNNKVYGPEESFQPADDPCEICTCQVMSDGEQHLRCYQKQCPSLVDCPKNHIHLPGPDQCCPTCAQPLSNCTVGLVGNEVYATDNPCYTCHCKDLTWVCIHQGCPQLSCPITDQFTPQDSCCPICDECVIEIENRRVSDGESWTDSSDDCISCTCNLGHIECRIEECLPVICQDGLVKVRTPGRCCYECQDPNVSCLYQGQQYQSNEHWEVDECTTCTCVSGEVHCQAERCPQVSCASDETPALIPGMCCPHCIPRPATCTAFGDPHYRTFDGKMIHFQGSCTYVLAEDCEGGDFSIQVTNDDRGRKGVSWTKEATVLIGDVVVQLLQDWVVMVDYQTVRLPFLKEPYIYIERKTNTILLNTNIGVKVLWNGKSHLEVSVPGTYKDHMCGLCGNFNNYPQDDMRIRTGLIVMSEAAFGNSWKVQGANHSSSQCAEGEDVDPCKQAGYRARKEANAKCKLLKSKVFERCHSVVPPEMFFASCVYDLCACGANADECLCDALEAYASECRESGVILHWRSPSLCAVGCPHDRGFIFDECGPPCPKTCFNKDVPLGVIEAHCFKPCTPGCQCPAGLVEHESHCILPEACPKIIYGSL
ncbi:kielin/chordin-like protein [Latimeria chalumnae]|uniref:kielin/chordin-like protein n=1 Tax=Latimeria chalumnae TaxID=7897 RepID=UPI00313DE103